jgi:hypothetical protein
MIGRVTVPFLSASSCEKAADASPTVAPLSCA